MAGSRFFSGSRPASAKRMRCSNRPAASWPTAQTWSLASSRPTAAPRPPRSLRDSRCCLGYRLLIAATRSVSSTSTGQLPAGRRCCSSMRWPTPTPPACSIPSAGRTSSRSWMQASTCTPRSTCSTSRASLISWSRPRASASRKPCPTRPSIGPTRSSSSTCRRKSCSIVSRQERSICPMSRPARPSVSSSDRTCSNSASSRFVGWPSGWISTWSRPAGRVATPGPGASRNGSSWR